MGFSQPVDIGNRACQHVGSQRIVTLADDTTSAGEISQCYDGLRRAELRRNVWTFSVRKAVLYPINTPVTSLPIGTATAGSYAMWNGNTVYTPGTIVQASDGLLYQCLVQNQNNNPAGGAWPNEWQLLGSPTQGDVQQNLPTMQLSAPAWSATAVYAFGAIVSAANPLSPQQALTLWQSTTNNNSGQTPGAAGVTAWEEYFGSTCVQPYDEAVAYFVGDLVYQQEGNALSVYMSLENSNSADPGVPSPWNSTTTYSQGMVVQDSAGYFWMSNISNNAGNQPGVYGFWSSTPTYTENALVIGSDNYLYQSLIASNNNINPSGNAHPTDWLQLGYPGSWPMWNTNTTYAKGAIVAGSDGNLYQSCQGSNTGNQPVGSTYNPNTPSTNWWSGIRLPVPWIANFGTSTANSAWLSLDAGVTPLNVAYPLGTGPSIQTMNKNLFKLPAGYLRKAPQDPKQGDVSFLGAPTRRMPEDWEINGEYIVSSSPFPIIFRFVADVTNVAKMDDMFCEGLGARIGFEICERVTQSSVKKADCAKAYSQFMGEARIVNAIEQGTEQPPEDDFITCRI